MTARAVPFAICAHCGATVVPVWLEADQLATTLLNDPVGECPANCGGTLLYAGYVRFSKTRAGAE